MSEVKRYCVEKSDLDVCWDGSKPEPDDLVMYADFDRVTTERDAALGREAALLENISRARPPHFCGLPMSPNPHPEAGVPGRYLEVGAVSECIPCVVASRHAWAEKAAALQQRLTAADERESALMANLNRAIELLRGTHTGDLFGPEDWATVDAFLAGAALKPAEGGGDEV